MKSYKIFFIFLLLPLFSSTCKKEGENCHRSLIFENNSDLKIDIVTRGGFIDSDTCFFWHKFSLKENESYRTTDRRYCWEDNIEYSDQEFFILDYENSNLQIELHCDSLSDYTGILKHIILTKDDLDDLRSTGFTINYP